jgi:CRP-like cAMP-binding protein
VRAIRMYVHTRSCGPLQVITPEGVVVGKLSDGAYFGEIAILVDVRRTSSVRTSCRCHFYKLSKEDFDAVLAGFPELKVSDA